MQKNRTEQKNKGQKRSKHTYTVAVPKDWIGLINSIAGEFYGGNKSLMTREASVSACKFSPFSTNWNGFCQNCQRKSATQLPRAATCYIENVSR